MLENIISVAIYAAVVALLVKGAIAFCDNTKIA